MASSSLSRAAMPLQIYDNSADIPPRSSLFPIHRLRHARSPACALACGAFLRAFPPVRGGRKVGCSLLAAACPHPTFGTTAVGASFPSPGVSQRRAAWLPPVSNPGKPGWLCFIFTYTSLNNSPDSNPHGMPGYANFQYAVRSHHSLIHTHIPATNQFHFHLHFQYNFHLVSPSLRGHG